MVLQRKFIPGSRWFYVKIYTSYKNADTFLINELSKILKFFYEKNLLDVFFFIRYSDPEFHIRVRFHLINTVGYNDIISIIFKRSEMLIKKKQISKIQIDTYEREIERYTARFMEFSEIFFCVDSIYIIQILRIIQKTKREELRWMISLLLVDTMLSEFKLNFDDKCKLFTTLSDNYKKEFNFNHYNSKQLNEKYRENKLTIESILNNSKNDSDFELLKRIVNRRAIELKKLIESNNYKDKSYKIIPSYIHMSLNRLFISHPRLHELLIYEFLKRYYSSIIKRNKYADR